MDLEEYYLPRLEMEIIKNATPNIIAAILSVIAGLNLLIIRLIFRKRL